jgi:antitoxin (DNA-binding transcriptional repressor) of toxin-antitoxin stability system
MKTITISTKEIRNDLEGFLKRLRNGQTIRVMYRSKPLVTLAAKEEADAFIAEDAGSLRAAQRSVKFIRNLPKRQVTFDSQKNFKDLYDETR